MELKKFVALISLLPAFFFSLVAETNDSIMSSEEVCKDSPFGLSLQLSSRYIWRGLEYGDAPVSFASISYEKSHFSAWAMGAYAFNGSHQEVDFGINYSVNNVLFGLSDYYYPSAVGTSDNYFDINNHTTGHWGELYATVFPAKWPVRLVVSCYVYGADKRPDGKQAYSSYAEVGYSFQFKDDNVFSVSVGANLNKGFYTNYEKGLNVVNVELKYSTSFNFGAFSLPVSGAYIINPYKEKSYFCFSTYFTV